MARNDALYVAMKAAEKAALEAQKTDEVYGVEAGAPPIAPWPTKPCRIIFLDFDGVLNSEQSVERSGMRFRFARSSVAVLNSILQKSGAYIVITSSWREHWTLRENAEYLERDGVLPGRVLGKSPTLGCARGLEINAWLHLSYLMTEMIWRCIERVLFRLIQKQG